MDTADLDDLERALTSESDRLAARRRWDEVAPELERRLRRPDPVLVELLVAGGVLGLLGFLDVRAWATGLALLVVTVPRRVGVLRRRRRRAEAREADLFAEWAQDVRRRFVGQVGVLVFGLPAVIVLGVYWVAVPETRVPLFLAAALVAYLPYHVLVRLRATAREWSEVDRWKALGLVTTESASAGVGHARPSPSPRRAAWRRRRLYIHLVVAVSANLLILARLGELLFDLGYHVPSALLTPVVGLYVLLVLLPVGDRDGDAPDRAGSARATPSEASPVEDEDEDEDDDDEGDDDFAWRGLVLQLLAAGLLFLGPPLVLSLLVTALLVDEPHRPLWIAGAVALAWIVQWRFFLPDGDEQGDDEQDGDVDDAPEERP